MSHINTVQMRSPMNQDEKVLREIENEAKKTFLPIIGPNKGKVLAEKVKEVNPKACIGDWHVDRLLHNNHWKRVGEKASIITIENHEAEAKLAYENIRKARIPAKVKVVLDDARKVISQLEDPFDFVFIDAEKTEYYEYLRLVENKIHRGTTIVADNAGIFAEQMEDYLTYVRKTGKYQSAYIPVDGDGLEISVKL